MQMRVNLTLLILYSIMLSACSPRDFLTRRLAFDLIASSGTFRTQQQFQLRTGILSNKDYMTTENMALQHRGWISAITAACPPNLTFPPCWDVALTPSGVETIQGLIGPREAEEQSFTIPLARRELIAITGIARQGSAADVEFNWKWVPLNEVGAALYSDVHYRSTVVFRDYDDGWRVAERVLHSGQPLDEALQNAEPAP
jgi:hypothetical protein